MGSSPVGSVPMLWPPFPYLLPHAVSLVVQAAVIALALRRHRAPAAMPFAAMVSGQAVWTLAYLFELGTPSLEGKVFWDNFEYVGAAIWVFGFFAFGVSYTRTRLFWARLVWAIHLAVAISLIGFLMTEPTHPLVRPTPELVDEHGFTVLVYPFTRVVWAAYGYGLLIFLGTMVLILSYTARVRAPYRAQAWLVVLGTIIPVAGTLLTFGGVLHPSYRDPSPVTFALGNVLIAWGLFRYRFLEIAPIARDVVFDNLRDLVTVLDAKNRVIDGNPALFQLLGMARSQVIGHPDKEVFAGWGDFTERFRGAEDAETQVVTHVGDQTRYAEVSLTTLRDGRGRRFGRVLVAHDITELKLAQAELEQRNQELRESNEELDAFSSSVSHDLRAPVRVIRSFASRLVDRASSSVDPDMLSLLVRIQANAEHMQSLIDHLIDFARLGRRPIGKRLVQPESLVRAALAELEPELQGRRVQIDIGKLPECQADPPLLRQVFFNLLANAIKFTRQRDPALIQVGARVGGDEVVYFVADNGIGFDAAVGERLFGVFQRLHEGSEFEGSGIGLASAKRIVTRHGGRIWAEAEPGAGATFFFTLGT